MARSSRQSKILELISTKEIETQEELARELKNANFEITQATISRDIKELGLTKIQSSTGKYKYAILGNEQQVVSNKYITIFKESVISVKSALNLTVVKTIKGGSVCDGIVQRSGYAFGLKPLVLFVCQHMVTAYVSPSRRALIRIIESTVVHIGRVEKLGNLACISTKTHLL